MSATPNNAAPGREKPRPLPAASAPESRDADGRNALQGLLAFACVQQQAVRRKRETQSAPTDSSPRFSREEELALDEILQLVAARAIAITGADGVAIALAKDRAIVCRASAGKIAPDPGVRLDPDSGFSGACLRSGETVRCDDADNDARVNPEACRALGARSMIAVPLSARHRVIGLLEAFSKESQGFNDSDVRSLNLLGELILAAIRPEEEHHLAEMASAILPEPPAPLTAEPKTEGTATADSPVPPPAASAAPAPVAVTPSIVAGSPAAAPPAVVLPASGTAPVSKILQDEKFAPAILKATPRISVPTKSVPEPKPAETITAAPPANKIAAVSLPLAKAEPLVDQSAVDQPLVDQPVLDQSAERIVAPLLFGVKDVESRPALYDGKEISADKPSFFSSAKFTAALILVVIGLSAAVVWKWQRLGQAISANTQALPTTQAAEGQLHNTAPAAPAPPLKIGTLAQVTGLHHSSAADASIIVVDLEDQVQYEAHSIDNPPRLYFDLHETKLGAGFAAQSIDIDDAFLKRVRVAQPVEGITRVVLETKDQPQFSVSLENNPYRLTINIHKPGTAPVGTSKPSIESLPKTMPKPSRAIDTSPNPKKTVSSSQAPALPGNFQIVLDAGHGGWDLGSVGRKGLLEKDLVLDVVQRLGTLLENKLGASVVYTRQDDSYLALEKRAEIANLAQADLFLSVHANYSDLSTARGVETYYTNTYSSVRARTADSPPSLQAASWSGVVDIRAKVTGARQFAADVQHALYGGLAARNPDIRNRGVKEAQYVVLTGTQMPAVLAEVSFISSPEDEGRLQNSGYRQMIAEALYRGVVKYREDIQRKKLAGLQKVRR